MKVILFFLSFVANMMKFQHWTPKKTINTPFNKMMFEFKVKKENTLPHNTPIPVENTSKTKMNISYILN